MTYEILTRPSGEVLDAFDYEDEAWDALENGSYPRDAVIRTRRGFAFRPSEYGE